MRKETLGILFEGVGPSTVRVTISLGDIIEPLPKLDEDLLLELLEREVEEYLDFPKACQGSS